MEVVGSNLEGRGVGVAMHDVKENSRARHDDEGDQGLGQGLYPPP